MRGDLSAGGCAPVLESIEEAEAAPHGQNPSIRPHLRSGQAHADLMSNKLVHAIQKNTTPDSSFRADDLASASDRRPEPTCDRVVEASRWAPALAVRIG
jgi:hypothetical protein